MLDSDQQKVVNLDGGSYKVVATAGAGKTETLLHRAARLYGRGKILVVTFTNESAKALRTRCAKNFPNVDTSIFSTLHALALKFAYEYPDAYPFKLSDNPLADEGVAARAVFDSIGDKINFRAFTSWVSLQKRNGVSPEEAMRFAEKTGVKLDYAIGYRKYARVLKEKGLLDFDDLLYFMCEILETRPDIRLESQYNFLMVDECQDLSVLDWRILQLLSDKYKNLMIVGDPGQCQPPGTLVTVITGVPKRLKRYKPCTEFRSHHFRKRDNICRCGVHKDDILPEWRGRGSLDNCLLQVPIEKLDDTCKVISWTKHDQRTYITTGRTIKVASRYYEGDLITIESNGNRTEVTPNHWLWVRWNNTVFEEEPYFVYLMYREDRGFRIGISHIRKVGTQRTNQLSLRARQEKAEKMWILKFVKDKEEAKAEEEILGLKYRIPQSIFFAYNNVVKTNEHIERVFKEINSIPGGLECLKDHGLFFEYPLFCWPLPNGKPKFHGFWKTEACNIVPRFMEIPLPGINEHATIDSISKRKYEGLVYSLDVEKDNTYIADGLVVGNSLFQFRGGVAEHFLNMEKLFPGTQVYYLGRNYRSTKNITEFGRKAYPYPEISAKFLAVKEELGLEPTITGYSTDYREAEEVVNQIKKYNPDDCAILARTNAALRVFEESLIDEGIKYHVLGDSGFWESTEVQHVLAYVRASVMLSDAAIIRAIQTPFWITKYIKKKKVVEELKQLQARMGGSIYSALGHYPTGQGHLGAFTSFIKNLFPYRYVPAGEAVSKIIRDLRAVEYYKEEENLNPDKNPVENLRELVKSASRFADLNEFLDFVRRVSFASKSRSGVCLSTVHASKGKEYKNVWVVAVNKDMLPHIKSEDLEGEKCCFFVACSRAEDTLHISYNGSPSPFLQPWLVKESNESISV